MNLDIEESQIHPYLKTMVEYHWQNNMPFIYLNRQGKLVQQWADGTIEYLVDEEEENNKFDKRYEKPFEDDGAYAD